jgi:hypothetical protein
VANFAIPRAGNVLMPRRYGVYLLALGLVGCGTQFITLTAPSEAGPDQLAGMGAGSAGTSGSPQADGSVLDALHDPTPSGPILVYTAPAEAEVRGITVMGPDIYWAEGGTGRGVFRMPKQSPASEPIQLWRTTNSYDVAVDARFLCWSDGTDYGVWRMPLGGGAMTSPTRVFSHNSRFPRYLTIDDQGALYVTSEMGGILAGADGLSSLLYTEQPNITGIAFYRDAGVRALLWGYDAGIRSGAASGAVALDVYAGALTPVQGVATDGSLVYWIRNDEAIFTAGITIPSVQDTRCLAPWQDLGPNADIAVDEAWIYFTWPNRNQIYKCPK